MTVTYDPTDPAYFDEADYRAEATRVYDLCQGCRLCWNLCPSFESLFDIVDTKYEGNMELLNHDEQDRIVNECYQCKLCYVKCPYTPDDKHSFQLDFPRLLMRANAIRRKEEGIGFREKMLARPELVGTIAGATAPLTNWANRQPALRAGLELTLGTVALTDLEQGSRNFRTRLRVLRVHGQHPLQRKNGQLRIAGIQGRQPEQVVVFNVAGPGAFQRDQQIERCLGRFLIDQVASLIEHFIGKRGGLQCKTQRSDTK